MLQNKTVFIVFQKNVIFDLQVTVIMMKHLKNVLRYLLGYVKIIYLYNNKYLKRRRAKKIKRHFHQSPNTFGASIILYLLKMHTLLNLWNSSLSVRSVLVMAIFLWNQNSKEGPRSNWGIGSILFCSTKKCNEAFENRRSTVNNKCK